MKKKQLDMLLSRYRKRLNIIDEQQRLTQQCGHGFLKGKILEALNAGSPDRIWKYDMIIELCLAGLADECEVQHLQETEHA